MEENNNIQQEKTVVKKKTSICGQLSLFLSFFVCTGLNIYTFYLIGSSGSSAAETEKNTEAFIENPTQVMQNIIDQIRLLKLLSVSAIALAVISIVLSIVNFKKKDCKKGAAVAGVLFSLLNILIATYFAKHLFAVPV